MRSNEKCGLKEVCERESENRKSVERECETKEWRERRV